MFRKFREQKYIEKHIKTSIESLIKSISEIRKTSEIIAICPKPIENNWQGVHNATLGLFPNNTLALPQYYSNPVYSKNELFTLINEIINLEFRQVVFSGYPSYFKLIIELLSQRSKFRKKEVTICLIYHGSFASNSEDNFSTAMLKEILELGKIGVINKIGFIKKGMSATIEKITGISSHFLIPKSIVLPINKNITLENKTHKLGVFTHNNYRKNIHNQVAAALMFENAHVHVHKNYDFDYLLCENRLVVHPFFKDYNDFMNVLAKMDLNFYVSFSECFGLVIIESLSLGVPCLIANNSGILDYDEQLKSLLIVDEFDDSNAIFKKAESVLENRQLISKKGLEYVQILNNIANEKLQKFLES